MADLPIAIKKHNIPVPERVQDLLREARQEELKSLIVDKERQISDLQKIQLRKLRADLEMLKEELKLFENEVAKRNAITI